MSRFLPTLVLLFSLSACTWVQPEPGADRVALVSPADAVSCQRLGQTTVSVRDRVAGVQRSPAQVAQELRTLARNSAIDLGGDTIVEEEMIDTGKQRFGIYFCGDR